MNQKYETDAFLRDAFEEKLTGVVAAVGEEPALAQAMNYSLLAGGKRLRPMMLLMTHAMLGGEAADAMPFACALEMIHTYSLIHDDLPAMDNDSLRRGRPTSHVVFGEAQAILAGDALLNGAFELMSKACLDAEPGEQPCFVGAMYAIAVAAGGRGMIRGQWLDLAATGQRVSAQQLETIHLNKTGALFCAAMEAAARLRRAQKPQVEALIRYARCFGMVFQMTDDILDVEGDAVKMGKSVGKDELEEKSTYVTLFGLEKTKRLAKDSCERAKGVLSIFKGPEKEWFCRLVDTVLTRDH